MATMHISEIQNILAERGEVDELPHSRRDISWKSDLMIHSVRAEG